MSEKIRSLVKFAPQDPVIRRLVTNSSWVFGSNSCGLVFGLIQAILVARALGVERYGMLGIAMTFVTVVTRFTSFRMNEFVIKFVSHAMIQGRNDEAAAYLKVAFVTEAITSTIAFAIICTLAPIMGPWFIPSEDAAFLIILYAFIVLGTFGAETTSGVLHVFNHFRKEAFLKVLGHAVTLVFVATAYMFAGGLWGILSALVLGSIFTGLLTFATACRQASAMLGAKWWKTTLKTIDGQWRSIMKFAFSTNLSATISLITKESDLLFLGYFRNPTEVGYYNLAFKLCNLLCRPIQPISRSLFPEIASSASRKDWVQFKQLLRKCTIFAAAYLIPTSLLFLALSPWLISLVYGKSFAPAAYAIALLIPGIVFAHIFMWSRPALLALDRADAPVKVNLLIAAIKIVAVLTLLPIFGYLGNAAILSALYLIGVSICVLIIRRELRAKLSGGAETDSSPVSHIGAPQVQQV